MTAEERYRAAAHAMQSGVAFEMTRAPDACATTPKHLRVGMNSVQVSIDAIVTLLIQRGHFTRDEYVAALADAMEREVERYERAIFVATGAKVNLK